MRAQAIFQILGVGLTLLMLSRAAWADGLFMPSTRLSRNDREAIQQQVARYKTLDPVSFQRLETLQGHRPQVYRQFRSQQPSVLAELQSLGPGAGWALLEAVSFRAPERGEATQREWDAVREGIIIALGEREMPEASPVFRAIFTHENSDWIALRGAAIGLGRLGGESEKTLLINALQRKGQRRDAALWGLRYVRDLRAVDAVVPWLMDSSEPTAKLAARALGYMGSSWAWRTGRAGKKEYEMPIRGKCAEALLDAFSRRGEALREPIARSLSMVEHPDTLSRVEQVIDSLTNEQERRAWLRLKQRLQASR